MLLESNLSSKKKQTKIDFLFAYCICVTKSQFIVSNINKKKSHRDKNTHIIPHPHQPPSPFCQVITFPANALLKTSVALTTKTGNPCRPTL